VVKICASQPYLDVEAQDVHFNGTTLSLGGDTLIQHSLGTLKAKKFVFIPSEDAQKKLLTHLVLEDEVEFTAKDGSVFSCALADLDQNTLSGQFRGSSEQPYVTFKGFWQMQREAQSLPLELTCREVRITLQTDPETEEMTLKEIQADREVTIHYGALYQITSDQATFLGRNSKHIPSTFFEDGVFTFTRATLTNGSGDTVSSRRLTIDADQQILHFDHPQGLTAIAAGNQLTFHARTLDWDRHHNTLALNDEAQIEFKTGEKLNASKKIELIFKEVDGKRHVSEMTAEGLIHGSIPTEDPAQSISLQCEGTARLNIGLRVLVLEGSPEHPVIVKNSLGILQAGKMVIKFDFENNKPVPQTVSLEGNVRLRNHSAVDPSHPGPLDQYALADRVELDLRHQQAGFYADPGKRILFFDRINNVKVSAPEMTAYVHPETQKETIKAKGDVRFSFLDHELDMISQSFDNKSH
jgi:Cu/Ag efflux protein CusF